MIKKHPFLALVFILAFAAAACNFPSRGETTPTPSGPDATFTAIAQVLEAALTQTAEAIPQQDATGTSVPPTLPPTSTAIPLITNTPNPPTPRPCNWAQFVDDVTIPDGTLVAAGETFTKTWRLKNVGTCNWTTDYKVVFDHGDRMNAPQAANLPHSVAPNETVDVSVAMTAPDAAGSYAGNWMLQTASGVSFGIGGSANQPFWVRIDVEAPTGPVMVYSFVDHMCDADWTSNAGILDCPGSADDNAGFVIKLNNPTMETGVKAGAPGLETHPLWESNPNWAAEGNGWIQGLYPGVNVKAGYHLKVRIGCRDGASSCNVNFYLKYSADGGSYTALGAASGYNETYDNSVRDLDFDLTSLSGKTVEFLFQVDANSNGGQDWAVWVNPRIEK